MNPSKWAVGVFIGAALLMLGSGAYYSFRYHRAAASAEAWARRSKRADEQLAELRSKENASALGRLQVGTAARAGSSALSDEAIAADLEQLRWKDRAQMANFTIDMLPYLRAKGGSADQIRRMEAVIMKALLERDQLMEIAKLSGVSMNQDPGLLAQKAALQNQVRQDGDAIMDQQTKAALDAYQQSVKKAPDRATSAAQDIVGELAAATFYTDSPVTADERPQLVPALANVLSHLTRDQLETADPEAELQKAGMTLPAAQSSALKAIQAEASMSRLLREVQTEAAAGAKQ